MPHRRAGGQGAFAVGSPAPVSSLTSQYTGIADTGVDFLRVQQLQIVCFSEVASRDWQTSVFRLLSSFATHLMFEHAETLSDATDRYIPHNQCCPLPPMASTVPPLCEPQVKGVTVKVLLICDGGRLLELVQMMGCVVMARQFRAQHHSHSPAPSQPCPRVCRRCDTRWHGVLHSRPRGLGGELAVRRLKSCWMPGHRRCQQQAHRGQLQPGGGGGKGGAEKEATLSENAS